VRGDSAKIPACLTREKAENAVNPVLKCFVRPSGGDREVYPEGNIGVLRGDFREGRRKTFLIWPAGYTALLSFREGAF
jgi:hypothetical protein